MRTMRLEGRRQNATRAQERGKLAPSNDCLVALCEVAFRVKSTSAEGRLRRSAGAICQVVHDVIDVNDLDRVLAALERPGVEPTRAAPVGRRAVLCCHGPGRRTQSRSHSPGEFGDRPRPSSSTPPAQRQSFPSCAVDGRAGRRPVPSFLSYGVDASGRAAVAFAWITCPRRQTPTTAASDGLDLT